jgi:predicted dehydrogenase
MIMPIRLIHAGLGGWGRNWAGYVIKTVKEVELVAAVEIDPASAKLAQKVSSLPANRYFTSLEEACNSVDADAVLVTAPLPAHMPLTLEALRLGKHVLCEKPFAPTLAEAREAVEVAEAQQRVLMVSQNYRFYPAVQAAADLIRTRELGAPGFVTLDFRRNVNTTTSERHRNLWHPLLTDMSIHHFDMMRMVLGQEPTEITCHAWNPPWSTFRDPASAVATILFDGGAVVSYRGSWVSPQPQTTWGGDWIMECAEGAVAWTSRGGNILDASHDRVMVTPLGESAEPLALPKLPYLGRAGSLHAFARAITDGVEPSCSARDNLGSLALMYAAIESAETGQPVSFASMSL